MKNWLPNSLIVVAVASRLLPHPPNFTSLNAVGLYAGGHVPGIQAYLVPVLAMLVTSPILSITHGHAPFVPGSPFVYLALILNVWLGRYFSSQSSQLPVTSSQEDQNQHQRRYQDQRQDRNEKHESGRVTTFRIGLLGLIASLQFFVITNFGVWLLEGLYPRTGAGLLACYTAALPFLAWNIAGTWVYSAALVGAHALLESKTQERIA